MVEMVCKLWYRDKWVIANEFYRWCLLCGEYLQYAVSMWCVNMDIWLVCRCTWCVGMSVIASPDVVANSDNSKVLPIGTTLTVQTTYFILCSHSPNNGCGGHCLQAT